MDQIKEAFQKVKVDIETLKQAFFDIKKELEEIQFSINNINNFNNVNNINSPISLNSLDKQTDRHFDRQINRQTDTSTHSSTDNPAQNTFNSAIRQINPSQNNISTHSSTDNLPFKSLKSDNIVFSTGNQGASTDRQTDRQTDTSTGNQGVKSQYNSSNSLNLNPSSAILVNQLDSFKKDIRLKVKRLTNQEMAVFSSIYQFHDQGFIVDYSLLSSKLNLTESSIRDYIQRIINKGFPLNKEKLNNKKIILHIPSDFKKLVSIDTLIKLREI